ncbi:hypothetical protein [Streptomyces sp. NTH33]|uniref:hypothetical protein n=1 Tax=Streptomyces sp. NTH33 TaxID=1735453 RepID=UPI0015E8BD4A|nr:hypothetical protein [Streptomyces sp. NTH33]
MAAKRADGVLRAVKGTVIRLETAFTVKRFPEQTASPSNEPVMDFAAPPAEPGT